MNLYQSILIVAAALAACALAVVILVHSRPARFVAMLALAVVLVPGSVAFAGADNPVTAPEDSTGTLLVISAPVITFLTGSLIPLLTAVLTRVSTPSAIKYACTIVLNAIVTYLSTELAEDGAKVISGQAFMTWLCGVAMSLIAYKGWKSLGLTSSTYQPHAGTIAVGKLARFGVR